MSTPVQTQILDLIEDRLGNISITNEYFTDVIEIERSRLEPFRNGDMPAINYYSTDDVFIKNINNGISERINSCIIEFYSTTRDRIFTDLANELSTDVAIALERETANPLVSDIPSPRLGGEILKMEVESITPAIGSGQTPYCGAIIVLNITYKVNRDNPFVLIN